MLTINLTNRFVSGMNNDFESCFRALNHSLHSNPPLTVACTRALIFEARWARDNHRVLEQFSEFFF